VGGTGASNETNSTTRAVCNSKRGGAGVGESYIQHELVYST